MAAVWPAGPLPIMTSLLCIFLTPTLALLVYVAGCPVVFASPAVAAEFFCFVREAAAARGRLIEARRVVALARRKVEENSLAVRCFLSGVWSWAKVRRWAWRDAMRSLGEKV